MKHNKKNFNKSSIKVKLMIIPLFVVITAVIAVSIISGTMIKNSLTHQMKETGEFILEQAINKMENNSNSLDIITNSIEEDIRKATKIMMAGSDELSSEKLSQLAEDLGIDEINYFNTEGVLIYSNIPENLMWEPDSDHPLFTFRNGDEKEMMEDIRQDPVSSNYLQYGAIKGPDGSMYQAGINANYINELTEKFNYQKLVEDLTLSDEITYAFFADKELKATAHSDESLIGTDFSQDRGVISAVTNSTPLSYQGRYALDNEDVYSVVYPVSVNGNHIGALQIGFSMEDVNSVIKKNVIIISLTGLLAILLLGFILFYTSNYAVWTINKLKSQMNDMALGDFSIDDSEKVEYKNDEFGEIYKSVDTMKQSMRDIIMNVLEKSQTLAAHSEELTATTIQSVQAADEVSRAIEDIANGSSDQALDIERGFQSVQNLGQVAENNMGQIVNLNNSTKKVNILKDEGLKLIEELVEKTSTSSRSSKDVQEAIMDTSVSAGKIATASEMIKNIASQTNLLALNASIEAARAGDAGKGFAVVAEEIRKLAEQSNQFTEEIGNIISDLISKTTIAVETIEEVKTTVESQSESVGLTSEKFTGISEALEEMEGNISEVSSSSQEINNQNEIIKTLMDNLSTISEGSAASSQEVSASTEEQTAAITEISSASEELSKISEELNIIIERFKI